ncbi:MarR family winged helix-turn-helix transcriptional regulator [Ottowia thiooxydans]|uniref:MarR family winged helix-turn-helix transcriptional regulator n=1 Tax=Ottowia thiooxydans TaxID=219182 RepID=UPI000685D3DE|nr:MarR family transcriptional regulator [Ottowia thiooxydans]
MTTPIPPPTDAKSDGLSAVDSPAEERELPESGTRTDEKPGFFSPETYEPQESLLYMLRRAMIGINQAVNEQTDLGGTSLPQWVPLHKVHLGHANTVADLARKCTQDAGAMTRLLDRLEAKGLCRRVRSESDRRVVHIELTPEGVTAAEQVPVVLSRVYNAALQGFSEDEWKTFQHLLGRLIGNAEGLSGKTAKERAE